MSKARDLAGLFNLGPRSGTTAQRPATADVGDIYYNGTTGKTEIYTTTGWKEMASGIPFGNTAARPAAVQGQPYFNGETQRLELFTGTSWENIVQEVPGVASISGNYSEATDSGVITIYGTNFVSGAYATAIGSNGVQINAASTVYNSLVQLTATFTGLSNAQEPYDIKVTNPSNLFGIIPDALYVNASPVWQTASGSLGTFTEQVSITLSALSATDSDSNTITYALASGSTFPTGITLNSSTGVISGSLPDIATDTTYSFTVNASDGLNVIPRTFSITSSALLIEYLLVGGGGSGGHDVGGGGGAGGLLTGTYSLSNTKSFAISVGAGAPAISNNTQRNNGENTTGFGLIAYGGGGGGNWQGTDNGSRNGTNGGSGGGGGGWSQIGYGGTGTSGQGFAGGNNLTMNNSSGGGGGGAGGPGQVSATGDASAQAAGGIGVSSSITGTSITYATGGKGGGDTTPDSNTSNGTDGLGNGGDGQGIAAYRRGGNGTLIIAYRNTYPALTIPGTLTYDQPTRSGYRVYRFTAGSGTVTF